MADNKRDDELLAEIERMARQQGARPEAPDGDFGSGWGADEPAVARRPPEDPGFRGATAVGGAIGLGMMGVAVWMLASSSAGEGLGFLSILIGVLAGFGAAMGGRGRQAQVVGGVVAALCYVGGHAAVIAATEPVVPAFGELVSLALHATFSGSGLLMLAFAVLAGWVIPRERARR